jgi:hypothetical protein
MSEGCLMEDWVKVESVGLLHLSRNNAFSALHHPCNNANAMIGAFVLFVEIGVCLYPFSVLNPQTRLEMNGASTQHLG